MNRDKKNLDTRQIIINSALSEFGKKSYKETSLNAIRITGNISKGIIYHYFKSKDELYLFCLKECFDTLTNYLAAIITNNIIPSIETGLERYFDARITFFSEYPLYQGLFYSAIMNPPTYLTAAINEISADFNAQSVSILTELLKTVKLRQDITIEEIVKTFTEYQDFINARFKLQSFEESTLKEHEERCRRSLKIMLYGVIERDAAL